MPVPGAPDALDDYRWDQIMQGIGPESLVVLNCANLSNYIPLEQDPQEQRRLRRLLRNLQNLLVKFQSGRAELWIETAEQTKSWLDDDRHADFFFEEPDTEAGSLAGEGEESETDDDPSQPGDDQDDPGSADGRDDGDGRGRSDYDYDEEYPDGDGGSGEHHSRVAVRPSSSRLSSSFRR